MKKNGYTLAEALISLAVIGVVAALILPMANKLKPDTTKIIYLKTYDSIVQITQQLASNNQVYPLYDDDNNIYYEKYPLANLSPWTDLQNNRHRENSKYCTLLADAFGASSNECSDANELSAVNSDFSQPSFTSTIGVVFDIRTICHILHEPDRIEYQSDIYIDIDGVENGNNCYYNFDDCTQPDRFKISVASNAKIIASDSKGQYYLNTRADSKLIKDLDNLAAQNRYPERNLEDEDRIVSIN